MTAPGAPEQQSQPVMPSPVPVTFSVKIAAGAPSSIVVLEVYTPTGVAVYFLEPQLATRVGKALAVHGREAATGLDRSASRGLHAVDDEHGGTDGTPA